MMNGRAFALLGLLLAITCTGLVRPAGAQVDPTSLANALRSGSPQQQRRAAQAIVAMPVSQRGVVIRSAVIEALQREQDDLEDRQAVIRAGGTVTPVPDHGEYLFRLLEVLVEYDDPANIRHLVPFIGTGNRVINALAAFGEQSLPAIATVAGSSGAMEREVSSALRALGKIQSRQGKHLSDSARQRIIEVVRQRLSGVQGPTVVMTAIDLALDVGDPGLEDRVRQLAEDADVVRSLGIPDEQGLVDLVQNHAKSALKRRS